jgi:hypothetical protein
MAWPAIFLAKLSILLLYLRIFDIKQSIRVGVVVGAVWAFLAYIPNIVVSGYFCAPHIGQPWDIRIGSTCDQPATKKWLVTSAAMSLALDIFILVLPIPVVLRLHLNAKRRIGVFLIFFTAVLSVMALFQPLARLER